MNDFKEPKRNHSMGTPQPTMLWESTDPLVALTKRFRFASSEDAIQWLIDTMMYTYGIEVKAVDRLVISSYNLLAWLTTATGPLIAKCTALVTAQERLAQVAELLHWLQQARIPVSAPIRAQTGEFQMLVGHLSVGVQRLIPGTLLDPAYPEQARSAGVILAQIHHAFATYPHATDFVSAVPVPFLTKLITDWAAKKLDRQADPARAAAIEALLQQVKTLDDTALTTQLVHGDYRAANILWDEDRISAVLDFEELRWGYRVNDLAWAAVHLGTRYHNWGPVAAATQEAFLNSYQSIHPLTATEEYWLPVLLTWHSINLVS
jgi:homoserine kinase type II